MSATTNEAVDEMFTVFKDAWDAYYSPKPPQPVHYPNVAFDVPTSNTPWARVTVQHDTGFQSTLAGDAGTRRFSSGGVFIVDLFTTTGSGGEEAYSTLQAVRNAFRQNSNCVWYRNARIQELGPDGMWTQMRFSVDFEYDEVS